MLKPRKTAEASASEFRRGVALRLTECFTAVILLLLFCTNALRNVENWAQDAFFQQPGLVSPDIYVIGIDEKTLIELGPFENWSRTATAELLEVLSADPSLAPAVIGIDIGFYGAKDAEDDARLAAAAARAGTVVSSSYASFGGEVVESDGGFYARRAVRTMERPYDALREVTTSGFTNVISDSDGIVRRNLFLLQDPDGVPETSFAHAIYRAYTGEEADPPLDSDEQWYIPFSAAPGEYFGASLVDLLQTPALAAQFAGSIVLIGPYSAGMMDTYYAPVSRSQQMYGVEVHANALQAMLEQNYKRELSPFLGVCIVVAILAAAFFFSRKLDLRIGGLISLLITAGYLLAARFLYHKGVLIPLVYPLLALWVVFLSHIFLRYLIEARSRRRILDLFGRYVSPQVAGSIVRQGESQLALGGQKRDIAVLFVDIRGFTTLSEGMEPELIVEILNRFFSLTTNAIFENGGTVDKFIGDATMAVFNAPIETDDYVYRAVKTGLAITQGAKELEAEILADHGKKVGFGVGINCGPAVVGNIGTPQRMEYTAIGDTVNTASRLEGQAAAGEVIVSEALYRRLEGRVEAECLGVRQLKGKSSGLTIYRVERLRASVEL